MRVCFRKKDPEPLAVFVGKATLDASDSHRRIMESHHRLLHAGYLEGHWGYAHEGR